LRLQRTFKIPWPEMQASYRRFFIFYCPLAMRTAASMAA
jgi:hypothetical protein